MTHIYEDRASGKQEERPGLCLFKALRPGDTLLCMETGSTGRSTFSKCIAYTDRKGIGLKVLTGHGATINASSAVNLYLVFLQPWLNLNVNSLQNAQLQVMASLNQERKKRGRPYKMTPVKLRFAMASMGHPETKVSTLCQELGITRQTLYRHISPDGQLRADGIKLLNNQ
ncbi:recombinase family protein [Escherichia coli]|nr:recombinase family protein [Escherichia coli]